jgi:hypothetical protein
MKKDWTKLSPADKNRLAACFFHLNADYRKSIMGKGVRIVPRLSPAFTYPAPTCVATMLTPSFQIDWDKATKDFKPEGKAISAASFRTSITRLLINYTPGDGVSMGTPASRKRKAATASASPALSTTASKRTKTARAAAVATESNDTENPEDPNEEDNNNVDEQAHDETQDNHNDQVDGPSDESPTPKTEPQSEWLGTGDMFQGDSSPHLSFMPVS